MSASNPNTINVLSVVDCQNIIANKGQGGTPENPISLGALQESDQYAHMIASSNFAQAGEGWSELNINANVGDTVRWSITCLHEGISYNVIMEGITYSNNEGVMTPPRITPLSVLLYEGQPGGGPVHPTSFTEWVMDATVIGTGQVTYQIVFRMLDRAGNTLGFYTWDPFITVLR